MVLVIFLKNLEPVPLKTTLEETLCILALCLRLMSKLNHFMIALLTILHVTIVVCLQSHM
jgi:hypothetical protein